MAMETVSRSFTKLQQLGLIRVSGKEVQIVDYMKFASWPVAREVVFLIKLLGWVSDFGCIACGFYRKGMRRKSFVVLVAIRTCQLAKNKNAAGAQRALL